MARKRDGTPASVEVLDNAPAGPAATSAEVLIAQHEGQMEKSVETESGTDGSVTTTHTRPGTMVMYKPTDHQGYVPKTVSVSSLRLLLRQGWQEHCPDCGKDHISKDGQHSTDPNLCSARDPVAVRVCRICRKRIYDNVRFGEEAKEGDDLNVIQDDSYEASTGATRTKASLDLHYWVRHPKQAQMMNIPPLPEAMRDMIEKAE